MTDEQLKTLCVSIIAAGIRMNGESMHKINHIAQEDNDHSERIVAMWALTTFEFVEEQIRRGPLSKSAAELGLNPGAE